MNLKQFKKILIIRLSSLGDILLSTPLIRSIKNQYPELHIDFLLRPQYKDVLINNPYITSVFNYNADKEKKSELIENLSGSKYDFIIDLQNNFRSAEIINKLKIPSTKFDKRSFDKFLLVNFKINRLKNALQIPERYIETVNIKLDEEGLDLYIDESFKSGLSANEKYIGFCPGSRHFTKMWPKEYFIELGQLLNKEKYKVVLFGGKSDQEVCNEISCKLPNSINLCNNNKILQTAADMKNCMTIVCNDSGLMHTACAVKTPVLAIFGSTVREFGFMPYKNKNSILENKLLSCRPCSHIGRNRCPKGHFKCMLEIKPKQTFDELLSLINS